MALTVRPHVTAGIAIGGAGIRLATALGALTPGAVSAVQLAAVGAPLPLAPAANLLTGLFVFSFSVFAPTTLVAEVVSGVKAGRPLVRPNVVLTCNGGNGTGGNGIGGNGGNGTGGTGGIGIGGNGGAGQPGQPGLGQPGQPGLGQPGQPGANGGNGGAGGAGTC